YETDSSPPGHVARRRIKGQEAGSQRRTANRVRDLHFLVSASLSTSDEHDSEISEFRSGHAHNNRGTCATAASSPKGAAVEDADARADTCGTTEAESTAAAHFHDS